jgi:hypothetical protein
MDLPFVRSNQGYSNQWVRHGNCGHDSTSGARSQSLSKPITLRSPRLNSLRERKIRHHITGKASKSFCGTRIVGANDLTQRFVAGAYRVVADPGEPSAPAEIAGLNHSRCRSLLGSLTSSKIELSERLKLRLCSEGLLEPPPVQRLLSSAVEEWVLLRRSGPVDPIHGFVFVVTRCPARRSRPPPHSRRHRARPVRGRCCRGHFDLRERRALIIFSTDRHSACRIPTCRAVQRPMGLTLC